jgi:hypothetical protein
VQIAENSAQKIPEKGNYSNAEKPPGKKWFF